MATLRFPVSSKNLDRIYSFQKAESLQKAIYLKILDILHFQCNISMSRSYRQSFSSICMYISNNLRLFDRFSFRRLLAAFCVQYQAYWPDEQYMRMCFIYCICRIIFALRTASLSKITILQVGCVRLLNYLHLHQQLQLPVNMDILDRFMLFLGVCFFRSVKYLQDKCPMHYLVWLQRGSIALVKDIRLRSSFRASLF